MRLAHAEPGVVGVFVPVMPDHVRHRQQGTEKEFRRAGPLRLGAQTLAGAVFARQPAVQPQKGPFGNHHRAAGQAVNPVKLLTHASFAVDPELVAVKIGDRILVEGDDIAVFPRRLPDSGVRRADAGETAAEQHVIGIEFAE
ncbi:hypothetical protein SDC9_212141 [bioreactor metagenome]|uniref:Uncharacterized protein n=1 Tax=bioreactor metagenome TaxID=1076179 RepID=A0A645JNN2_9ZZZZ